MKKLGAVQYLKERLYDKINLPKDLIDYYFDMAKDYHQLDVAHAMFHALDEDGHTGDWKIKFIQDYYTKTFTHENND